MATFEDDEHKDQVLQRLRRIEGQVRGLQRMVQQDKDCEDVLTQLAAVRAALDRVGVYLITRRMRDCLAESAQPYDPDAVEKAFEVFLKYATLGR